MRALVFGVVALLALAGCGSAGAPPAGAAGFKLYEAAGTTGAQSVGVIDTATDAVERTLPWGILDGNHLYSVTATTLSDIDPLTGSTLRTMQLPGYFQLPVVTAGGVPGGLSQNGRWLVLVQQPSSPTSSHLLVIDTSHMSSAVPVDLRGTFDFDAISNDGQRLYLIEYLSGPDYRVRVYNLPAGSLESYIVVDKSDPTEPMAGIRLSGVASPDGQWLYSVYSRPDKSAFIHALNLSSPFAFCLELPGSGYQSNPGELAWSLALSADGSRLFATNGTTGVVAEVESDVNGTPAVVRTGHVDTSSPTAGGFVVDAEAKEIGAGGSVLSADGQTLLMTGTTGVVWVDTATFRARSLQLADWAVRSLELSPDGGTVFALSDSPVIAELSMANPGVSATFIAMSAEPIALMRVDSPPGA